MSAKSKALTASQRSALSPSDRTLQLIDDATAPTTQRVYESVLRTFGDWLDERSIDDLAIAEHLTDLHAQGKSVARCALLLASLNHFAKRNGQPSPIGKLAQSTLAGIRRQAKPTRQARGIGWRDADLMVAVADQQLSVAAKRDAAMIALASDALLRVSEVVALDVDDLTTADDGSGRLTIRRSKTDQHAQGKVLFVGKPTMRRIRDWQAHAGVWDGRLFRRLSKAGNVIGDSLSPQSARAIIRTRAAAVKIDGDVNGHSLRVGSAQSLAEHGCELPALMEVGRWKSAAMPAHYARGQLAARSAVAKLRYAR
ncbi:MAG: tyrosine-type recombinase/integrase [Gammaproteobacteria bacterium]|nr:tyrosine-type recombinase/integrase [Gammaproteobacteria bacterium]